jgi:hypothetical protein
MFEATSQRRGTYYRILDADEHLIFMSNKRRNVRHVQVFLEDQEQPYEHLERLRSSTLCDVGASIPALLLVLEGMIAHEQGLQGQETQEPEPWDYDGIAERINEVLMALSAPVPVHTPMRPTFNELFSRKTRKIHDELCGCVLVKCATKSKLLPRDAVVVTVMDMRWRE